MPAGPIGSVWGTGTWSDTAWEANTWADATVATEFEDLTTVFVPYVVDLREDAVTVLLDSPSLVMADVPTVRNAAVSPDDLNTAYAEYLS